ncbi:MAG: hypothetical protein ACRC68_12550 [Clostridium sp.]
MVTKENKMKLDYINSKYNFGMKIGDLISLDTNKDTELKDIRFVKLVESNEKYYLVPCTFEFINTVEDINTLVSLDKWSNADIDYLFEEYIDELSEEYIRNKKLKQSLIKERFDKMMKIKIVYK